MMVCLVVLLLSPAFAALDGYYSSAREIELIVTTKADQVREALGTAYPIESIVARPGGYLVSARNNKDQLCTVSLTILKAAGKTPYGPPILDLKTESVSCK